MKYIKTYEKYEEPKYKVGDYVLLDLDKVNSEYLITDNDGNFTIPALVLITKTPTKPDPTTANFNSYYEVEFYIGGYLDIREEYIKRLLTPEEIDEYKMKKDAIQYNL